LFILLFSDNGYVFFLWHWRQAVNGELTPRFPSKKAWFGAMVDSSSCSFSFNFLLFIFLSSLIQRQIRKKERLRNLTISKVLLRKCCRCGASGVLTNFARWMEISTFEHLTSGIISHYFKEAVHSNPNWIKISNVTGIHPIYIYIYIYIYIMYVSLE